MVEQDLKLVAGCREDTRACPGTGSLGRRQLAQNLAGPVM